MQQQQQQHNMKNDVYDALVVGAGVEGSATALQLRRKGVRVLLLEQFPLPHSRGSSHGQSRITRRAYPESFYTHMMDYCTREWAAINQTFGQSVFKKVGFMAVGKVKGDFIKQNVASMESNGAAHTLLDTPQFRSKFPQLNYDDGYGAMLDPEGGVLMADKAVKAFQSMFVELGGHLRDGEQVVSLHPGQVVKVVTNRGQYQAKSVVLCCGAWTNKMLKPLDLQLPLQPVRISVCYWPEKQPGSYAPEKFFPFMEKDAGAGHYTYGMPSLEYPGHVKICLHQGPAIDPEKRDDVDAGWTVELMKDYIRNRHPGLVPEPSLVESCIYTWTPDENFILDCHPKWKNIVIGAGFSGHGFKLAPAVGHILAHHALQLPQAFEVSHFRIDRFPATSNSKVKANL